MNRILVALLLLAPNCPAQTRGQSKELSTPKKVMRGLNFHFNPYSKESKTATGLQVSYLLLNAADYATTKVALSRGGREGNPVLPTSEPAFTLVKFGVGGFINCLSKAIGQQCHEQRPCRIIRFTMMGIAVGANAYVVNHDIHVVNQLGRR